MIPGEIVESLFQAIEVFVASLQRQLHAPDMRGMPGGISYTSGRLRGTIEAYSMVGLLNITHPEIQRLLVQISKLETGSYESDDMWRPYIEDTVLALRDWAQDSAEMRRALYRWSCWQSSVDRALAT